MPDEEPMAGFAARLRELRSRAGGPSVRELERLTDKLGRRYPRSTIDDKLNGRARPEWEFVETFVRACARFAGRPLAAGELDRWRSAQHELDAALARSRAGQRRAAEAAEALAAVPADAALVAARRSYVQRLRERYGRIDLEVLSPRTDQDGQPPVRVREVFVAQSVRADPPPVELPTELPTELRRWLVDAGEVRREDLPDGVDRKLLARVRRAYRERPARPVLAVLAEAGQQRLVLLGDPGSGKSTLARYLVLVLAEERVEGPLAALSGWLPLLVELRTYADERWRTGTFLDLIDHLHATEGVGLPKAMLDRFLREDGRAVVIFDGLDELFDPQLRETVAHQIAGFAARYPATRVVVTSRVIGYRRTALDSAGFSHQLLQDLDERQIDAFVTGWYRLACPADPREAARLRGRLSTAMATSAAIRELAGNPLLLTILAIIGRHRELPRDRRAVYEHAVTVLIDQWDPSRHLRDNRVDGGAPYLDHHDRLELLRLVARRMQDRPAGLSGNHIPGPELIAMFDSYLRERYDLPADRAKPVARAMLDQFRERNFILGRFGVEVYGFVHRAFLDYLAAADIVHRLTADRTLTGDELIHDVFGRHWPDPAWHEPLLLVAGMVDQHLAGRAIDKLLAADPLWFLRPNELPRHASLAIRCAGEVHGPGHLPVPGLAGTDLAVTDLVITLLEAVQEQEISRSDLARTVPPVFAALRGCHASRDRYRDWYLVRGQFLTTMHHGEEFSWMEVPPAAPVGAALLSDSPEFLELLHTQAILGSSPAARQAAMRAVAAYWPHDPGTVALLRGCAAADPDGNVQYAAVYALAAGWRDDPDTLAWLRGHLADHNRYRRQAAISALAGLWPDHPDTVPLLHERAGTDRDASVRLAALRGLAAGWRSDPQTAALLRERATTDPDAVIRQAALRALTNGWRDPDTMRWLREHAEAGRDEHVRPTALGPTELGPTALGPTALGPTALGPTALGAPADALRNPDRMRWLREQAAAGRDEYVRQDAVHALATGWGDHPELLAWLRGWATTDLSPRVRQAAVNGLATGGRADPQTATLLRELATDSDSGVRKAVAESFAEGWGDDPEAGALLRTMAGTDADDHVREAAAKALATGWRTDPRTAVLLGERAAADRTERIRLAALQALALEWRHHPGTLPRLRERGAGDESPVVRRAAVRIVAAGWRDDPATLPWLRERASTDQSPFVRCAAVRALAAGWRHHRDTVAILLDLAADPDPYVREAAMLALAAGWRRHPDTAPLLAERATTDPETSVRTAAVRTLGAGWRDDPGRDAWLREIATSDPHEQVRVAAVCALARGWRDDPGMSAWLRGRATADRHEDVREVAVWALARGWRDDPDTLPWLRERATADRDEGVRQQAVQLLAAGWRDDPHTAPLLRERATADPGWYVQQAAVRSLADGWPDDPDIQALVDSLGTDEWDW